MKRFALPERRFQLFFRKRPALWLSAAILAAALLSPGLLSAQSPAAAPQERITLTPTVQRYTVKPGESVTGSLSVINDGDTAYDFVVYARPYTVVGEDYQPNFGNVAPGADAYQWVRFDATRFRLQPGQKTTVSYTLLAPQNATPGGHYGVIFAETQPSANPADNFIARKKRIGSILYVTVSGDYKQAGNLLEAKMPFWQTGRPLSGYARLKNSGNVDFQVNLKLKVSDVFGRVKYQSDTSYSVLPATVRRLPLVWQDAPAVGLLKVSATFSFLDQTKTAGFWVLMMPRWLVALLVVVVGGAGGYYVLKSRRG